MKSMLAPMLILAAACLSAPAFAQAGTKPGKGHGLAIGHDPRQLQMTRDANAGAGNGGEFVKVKGSFSLAGCSAHNMSGCFAATYVEIDPGNSGTHNQSPECDLVACVFDPHR